MAERQPETDIASAPETDAGGDAARPPPNVFINYRHSDSPAHALLLHRDLKGRFGESNVFLDVIALKPGMDWRKVIHARANACGVLIVLMGQKWLSLMQESTRRAVHDAVDDVARQEIELALNSKDIEVVPVLVDDAAMPAKHELPRSLQALPDRQAEQLRLPFYDEDMERLLTRLERLAPDPLPDTVPPDPGPPPPPPDRSSPLAQHHGRVAALMSGAGHVIAVLGSGVNTGSDAPPNAERLALDLASRFAYEVQGAHPRLSEVAEFVDVTCGKPDLYLSLKENFALANQPGSVHGFFAGLPASLEKTGRPRRHQLIVTTNYDTALESAFETAGEPYDLAVYMASKRTFVHVPWEGSAAAVTEPNHYHAFPIGDDLELTRTVIVKIHGAIAGLDAQYGGEDNFVITEDQYIDYLSGTTVEEIVPVQILQKLRSSHCLFLGYDITNWNLRVFLKRVWGPRIRARSWAVQEHDDNFHRELWRESGAEVFAEPLETYVDALHACLEAGQ
jgi:hypothetical protein